LDSAESGDIEPSSQSSAIKAMIVIKIQGAEFRLDQFYVQMIAAAIFITRVKGKIHEFLSNLA